MRCIVDDGHRRGIFSWYGYLKPLEERLESVRSAGFDSLMLWWGDALAFSEHGKADLVRLVRNKGLRIENIHVPYLDANDIWSDDGAQRRRLVGNVTEWIRDCAEFGISTLVMHISYYLDLPAPTEAGLDAMMALALEARRRGVRIALENTDRLEFLEYLLDSVDSPWLGLCYDTSHGRLREERPFSLLRKYGDRLFALHLSDNDGLDDRHWELGKGVVDWSAFADALAAGERPPVLCLEVIQDDPEEDETTFLRRSLAFLDRLAGDVTDVRKGRLAGCNAME
ncbi:sugar phosphate isomerase/epimerase family protein [Aminiphilus circumscriptus]|uniref:sugar phosphate isomerase/epimerase family protein n=1 Tax=Aminiphilus circumscriptus TaxID=290732 RepID=UPI0004786242|nr:sugar phosphate isomerase/epimerase family protein [Aminiphilus circumscriptus]